jgi:nitrogen-specific signal transduction histidine kinase
VPHFKLTSAAEIKPKIGLNKGYDSSSEEVARNSDKKTPSNANLVPNAGIREYP